MRKFKKDEKRMMKMAEGKPKGRKVKLSKSDGAGKKLKGVKNAKRWKQSGAKSKVA